MMRVHEIIFDMINNMLNLFWKIFVGTMSDWETCIESNFDKYTVD